MNDPILYHVVHNLLYSCSKIGIFDSGLGGLSLLKPLLATNCSFVYYADTAHAPYGNKSIEEIQRLSFLAIQKLVDHQVDAIIIACHTASTNALSFLQQKFPDVVIIDVVRLLITQISEYNTKIGIMATQASINSNIHAREIKKLLPNIQVINQACPLLASAIENQEPLEHLNTLIQHYVQPLIENNVEIILLACTHYSLIAHHIRKQIPSTIIIHAAEDYFKKYDLSPLHGKNNNSLPIDWLVTDQQKSFIKKALRYL